MDSLKYFQQALSIHGYYPPEIIGDGNIHRFSVNGKPDDEAGWYILFSNGPIMAGAFGDWRSGKKQKWSEKAESKMTDAERTVFREVMKKASKLRAEIRRQKQEEAQKRANLIWQQAETAGDDHPYLIKKGVPSYGLRIHNGVLVLPLRDSHGDIKSLVFIGADGKKRNLAKGQKEGRYFEIAGKCEIIYLVEGYATGASIHETQGDTVIVCCDAGNLKPVSKVIRSKFPKTKIVICADDDAWTEDNPGLTKAREAAEAIKAQIVSPKFKDSLTQPTDFNDLHQLEGIEEVRWQLIQAQPAYLVEILRDAFNRNEEGDASLIKKRYAGRLVFDHNEGVWYRFREHHWHRDDINTVREVVTSISDVYTKGAFNCMDLRRRLLESEGPELNKETKDEDNWLLKLEKNFLSRAGQLRGESRAKKVLSWAAAGEPLGVTSEVWEPDPWLLGASNGVVDLKTGKLRPGRPDDYIRTICPVAYAPDAICPTWERFLLDIFTQPDEGDQLALFDYFHKMLGYTLIGDCREAIFAILYGEGRNGKTTLLETIRHVLGPYSFKASSELVLKNARPSGAGSPDPQTLALRHRRFVYCSETEEGRLLDGNRVKHLCGNDSLSARGLYEKRPTVFLPTHTLYLITNDKPKVRSDDFAIWQRIKPVPFLISFVDEPKGDWQKPVDKDMQKKLIAEAVGILAWLVDGAQLYQKEGLETPAIVTQEAQEYRSAESLLQQWAQENCVIQRFSEATSKDLFNSFKDWLERNRNKSWTKQRFSRTLLKEFREYGVEKGDTTNDRGFKGIRLK